MNILIPMAGEGSRFKEGGYRTSKPAILTYDRRTGKKAPMVVCATRDLPGVQPDGSNVIYIVRDYHVADGTQAAIIGHYPNARFMIAEHLTEGQACTCLLAESLINPDEELLVAGCDNGMEYDKRKFDCLKQEADVLVFTYRHNEAVLAHPDAYGWMIVDDDGNVIDTSVKKHISGTPMEDHAVVATFWFKMGGYFVESVKRMIAEDDRVNNEFYVDQAIWHAIRLGYRARVFEIDRYIGWGTPQDYENYQKTFEYWRGFCAEEGLL